MPQHRPSTAAPGRRRQAEHAARAAAETYARLAPLDRALLDDDMELTPSRPGPAARREQR